MGLIIVLILVGILLLLAEILLIPGVGVAGVLGLGSLIASCYIAFRDLGTAAGIIVTIFNVCLVVASLVFVLRSKTWKKLELDEVIDKKGVDQPTVKVGDTGITITRLAPMGTARIDDKGCEVTSVDGLVDPGEEIEVVRIENQKIFVKPIPKA